MVAHDVLFVLYLPRQDSAKDLYLLLCQRCDLGHPLKLEREKHPETNKEYIINLYNIISLFLVVFTLSANIYLYMVCFWVFLLKKNAPIHIYKCVSQFC